MSAHASRRRLVAGLAAGVLIAGIAVPVHGAARPSVSGEGHGTAVVDGEVFEASDLPTAPAGAASASGKPHLLRPLGRHPDGARPAGRPVPFEQVRASSDGKGTGASAGAGIASVGAGIALLHTPYAALNNYDATGGIVGSRALYGVFDRIIAAPHLPNGTTNEQWDVESFFNLPNDEFYFGVTVGASIYKGRFVAALPSFKADCTTGYMNVAVSTSTDPLGTWRRFRISMGDAWSDYIRLGVSDNKVVLATDRWDLDDEASNCLGEPYEGSRLRVADWTDLLDGGTVTSRDVSPSTSTNYFALAPATNVPTSSSTTSSTTIYIAGDKFASGTWGNVVLMTVTGGAKSGTAKLARNENLTTSGEVSLLNGPPSTIAAFSSGNGFQDERVVSATWRSGKLYFSSTGSCQLVEDTDPRACARYTLLNTANTPATETESVYLTDVGRDTFLPLVGFSRDGGAYYLMAASSALAQEPIDELATYRPSGGSLLTGDLEVTILEGSTTIGDTYFGSVGSVIAAPNDSRAVVGVYSAVSLRERDEQHWGAWTTQLRGGQTADPGGSLLEVGNGSGFANTRTLGLVLRPTSSSPIKAFRYSASSTVDDTADGPVLVNGKTVVSLSDMWDDFGSSELGGTPDGGTVTVYGQWQAWDGTWSTPTSQTITIDTTEPVLSNFKLAFTTGTIGTNAPIKLTWAASDAESGLEFFQYFEERAMPSPHVQFFDDLPLSATSYTRSLRLSSSYRYDLRMLVGDRAGNSNGGADPLSVSLASVPSSANIAFVKTWSTGSNTKYLGGTTRYATASGATVTYTFSGRAIAFLSTKSPSRGKAEVWVDGVKKATIDLYSSTTKYRQVAYQTSWDTVGNHVIMVKVLGTSGRPRVDFDSFLKAY